MDSLTTHPSNAHQAKAFTSPASLSFPGGAGDLTPPSTEKEQNGANNGQANNGQANNGPVNNGQSNGQQGAAGAAGNGATPATPVATPGAVGGVSGIVPTLQ